MSKLVPEDAPVLVATGIAEDKIEADLMPAVIETVPATIPAHHIQCCYEALKNGSSVDSAASLAGIPRAVAAIVAKEISTCADKLGAAAPAACKAEAEKVEAKPIEEPIEEPKGELGEGEVIP